MGNFLKIERLTDVDMLMLLIINKMCDYLE